MLPIQPRKKMQTRSVYLSDEAYAKLNRLAQHYGTNVSPIVETLIQEAEEPTPQAKRRRDQ